jgi:hypothetical protein
MLKRTLTVLTGTVLLVLMTSPCHPAGEGFNFNPKDPKVRNLKTVNGMLDACITKKDRDNVEKLTAYTQDRASNYALLIMSEFYEELSMGKLETVKQESPERWEVFQMYLSKSLAWLSLTKKADDFLGGHLESTLKAALGEK